MTEHGSPTESARKPGLALIFPGQGSQAVGMGKELADNFDVARRVFDEADEALGMRISALCFEGPADQLQLTANTQPAILTCSMAAHAVLRTEVELHPTVALGHSLGEFSALVAAGALEFADAVRLVRLRGEAMQAAVPPGQGAMAAILKLDADTVEALCKEAAQGEIVAPANENGGGQIVVAGHAAAVERLVVLVKSRKGRGVPLKVSAPFHCSLMQPAAERLAAALASVKINSLQVPVIANVDAQPNHDAGRVCDLLIRQVTHRVRWESSVQRAAALGVAQALEVGHGKVLAGLLKRISPAIPVRPVGSPGDIDVLKESGHDR